jgi:predicted metal-dependent hydrolase
MHFNAPMCKMTTSNEKIIKKSQETIQKIVAKTKEKVKKQNEIQKETLEFLHTVGFEQIDQNLTTQIITELQASNYAKIP